MEHKTKRIAINLLLSFAMMLLLILAMSASSWAAEKEIGEGVTYEIGDTIVVSGDTWLIWDDSSDIPNIINPDKYVIGEPQFDDGQFVMELNAPSDDYLALGAESDPELTGDEVVTGIKCYQGEGTEEEPYEFTLIFKQSGDETNPVSYLTWDETQNKLVEKTCTNYNLIESVDKDTGTTDIGEKNTESWYVVDGKVTIANTLWTDGDLHLILKDNSELTIDEAISIDGDYLTIYAQSTGDNAGVLQTNTDWGCMISGFDSDLTINGGKFVGTGKEYGVVDLDAGLGNPRGNLTINGGEISATCEDQDGFSVRHNVTINGGKINIESADGEGIDAGIEYASGNSFGGVTINDGEINLTSIDGAAGIYATSGVEINGGKVIAKCLNNGAGIYTEGDVEINGGMVIAAGKGTRRGTCGISAVGGSSEILIDDSLSVKAGDNENNAVYVTDRYKGQYTKRLVEDWVKIGKTKSNRIAFKVANGSWNDGTTATKTVTVKCFEDEALKLSAGQIPAVGKKPKTGYKAGRWNATPSTKTEIKADTTYKYTYELPKVGSVHKVSGSTYILKSKSTVYLIKAANKQSFALPATVKIYGKAYKVAGIQASAFKGTKVKTLTVKTKALTKKSVKGSLKSSKVTAVKVKVGKKADNKKYVKTYKKCFTKKNAGKKVSVK